MLADFGTGRYLIRRVAQEPEEALDGLSHVLSVRIPTIPSSLAILNLAGLAFMPDRAGILFWFFHSAPASMS